MPNLVKTIKTYSDGSIEISDTPVNPTLYDGWRVLHYLEYGNPLRSRPEVELFEPDHKTSFPERWQKLSYDLNTTLNPLITANMEKKKWRALYRFDKAFMNGTGFEESGDPRADFINRLNLTSPLPKFDKPRVCGGAFLRGREVYSVMQTLRDAVSLAKGLIVNRNSAIRTKAKPFRQFVRALVVNNMLEVVTMNVSDPVPSLEWVIENNMYFDAVNCGAEGTPGRFPQGTNGNRVFVPLITSQPVRYPLAKLQRWQAAEKPDPYRLYLT